MSLFIERELGTVYGPIDIAITRASHVSVQGTPVVRDSKFNCHLHFYLHPDGKYAVRDQDNPKMTRAWDAAKSGSFNEKAPVTYFAKVLAEYTTVVNAFMSSNQNLATEAESNDIERDISSAQDKVNKARQVLQEAEEALTALEAKRLKFQRSQAQMEAQLA